jgi:hypothetical protein
MRATYMEDTIERSAKAVKMPLPTSLKSLNSPFMNSSEQYRLKLEVAKIVGL